MSYGKRKHTTVGLADLPVGGLLPRALTRRTSTHVQVSAQRSPGPQVTETTG